MTTTKSAPYTVIFKRRMRDPIQDTHIRVHVMAAVEQNAWGTAWEKLKKQVQHMPSATYPTDFDILRCESGHT